MNKHTADATQFLGRTGNHSTRPSARGVNLLGWGEEEVLTNEQKREALVTKVKRLQQVLLHQMPAWERKRIGKEVSELNMQINALRPKMQGPKGVPFHFLDVAREGLPKLQFSRFMAEASRRAEVADSLEAVKPARGPEKDAAK